MNSYAFLKRTIISRKSIALWITVLLEIYIVLKYKNLATIYNFQSSYENMLLLFKFSVIIIQYLFFISMYVDSYSKDYIFLRYGSIKTLKKITLKDVAILTVFFVFMFNIIAIILIKVMFNSILISEGLEYMILTIIIQLFSFLFLGYLCVIFFFKTNSVTLMVMSVLILYFVLILAFQDTFSYFVLPADVKKYEIITVLRIDVSIFIISIIFSLYNKDKVVEVYGKKI